MQAEVLQLKKLRAEVMERLIAAREMGDLSENGAYKYAKFELGNIGRQLKKYEGLLAAGFPQERSASSKVSIDFGSIVTVQRVDDPENIQTFTIVSKYESKPTEGFIAFSSPMGKATFKKKQGDTVVVITPRGEVSYLITQVS